MPAAAWGPQGIPTMFLMTDNQIVKEQFLVYINDLLSTGVVSDLFTQVGALDSVYSLPWVQTGVGEHVALSDACRPRVLPSSPDTHTHTHTHTHTPHLPFDRRIRRPSATLCAPRSRPAA